MAEKTISTRHKQKYDTSTNWATNNIVLLAGEIGIESDTNKFKVGNGTSTWNELDYAGGETGSIININGQPQSTINFDSDPQTQIDNIVNNTTLIQNNDNGGFSAGYNSVTYGGGAVGADANSMYGGAVGYTAFTENGSAIGDNAKSTNGGAVGQGARTSNGFAGGYDAKTVSDGLNIDAIQLGTGTNAQTKTLQVYDDNIYNANTHTLNSTNANITTLNTVNITINGSNIINHGSNSNGDYIQFYNGTQICIGTVTSEGTKTYASPFTANPVIVCGIINSSSSSQISYRTMSAYNITSTNFYAQLTGSTSKTYIAIGKYK